MTPATPITSADFPSSLIAVSSLLFDHGQTSVARARFFRRGQANNACVAADVPDATARRMEPEHEGVSANRVTP
jgi:hypothetical protein